MKVIAVLPLCVTLICQGYSTGAKSCKDRCGEKYNSQNECHCNSKCTQYKNCCSDYTDLCDTVQFWSRNYSQNFFHQCRLCQIFSVCDQWRSLLCYTTFPTKGGGSVITDAEIKGISETLYTLDSNKASASQLNIDPQALVPNSQTNSQTDLSSRPFFRYLDETSLFSRPTYSALLALLDNYHRMTGQAEDISPQQLVEQETFIKETMSNTKLGRELFAFFYNKGLYASEEEFLQDLKMMWFGLYSRSNNKNDSSGFEHVFAGEVKGGKVSGFHNWIQFYLLEKKGQLNYYSHSFNGPWTTYPDVLGMQFIWDGYFKQLGSAVIGSSPEFDFAIYSLCYITRPGKQCRLSLGGNQLNIQTYTWDKSFYGDGKKFIASAYPATP
ncbi:hypothetical protein Q8A73_005565 [Channa argus]|nr:hypothetical protein Q8A73_005565 [Channa argus]